MPRFVLCTRHWRNMGEHFESCGDAHKTTIAWHSTWRSGRGRILGEILRQSREHLGPEIRQTFYSSANQTRPQGGFFVPLADQTYADKLNGALVDYGLGEAWGNAYEAVELPDSFSGIQKAIRAAFGRDLRAVAPTAERFDAFNGIYVGGEVYVSTTADSGFVQIDGHELYHHIERARPDLIRWYVQRIR